MTSFPHGRIVLIKSFTIIKNKTSIFNKFLSRFISKINKNIIYISKELKSRIILRSLYPTPKNLCKILAIRRKLLKSLCKTKSTPKYVCILDPGIPMILLSGFSTNKIPTQKPFQSSNSMSLLI